MKKYKHLTAADRGAIQILLHEQYSLREIAKKLGRNPSTISREVLKRSTPAKYDATIAHINYQTQRKKSKSPSKLNDSTRQKYVIAKLMLGWSPEQISGRMKLVESDSLYVCPETIYHWLYSDPWAHGEERLYEYLRYGRKKRKQQTGRSVNRSKIPNRISIHLRPKVVSKRKELGHWEGDSVIYPHKMAINTINELTTGLVAFSKLDKKTAKLTAVAMIKKLNKYSSKTLTLDNGSEFMDHQEVAKETGVKVFFADPYASWQRGANENANMLLRGYLPKRHNIKDLSQDELDDIAEELNNRPRKRLGYYTPNERYQQLPRRSQSVALDTRM
jgi:IS30 family transposase